MTQQPVHALTSKSNAIVKVLLSEVTVFNPFSKKSSNSYAIWDTGAMNTVITKKVASDLGLIPVGKVQTKGVHETHLCNVYKVNIVLNNKSISIDARVTECGELLKEDNFEAGLLIGMDIITLGDFTVTNFNKKTTFSFRVPSVEEIDFVEQGREADREVLKKFRPNDKCPCGSKKKFKRCCGKKF